MEGLDNNAWVFDSLVGFLHGPVWNIPLQTFIEEKSLPFEPTTDGHVQNRPEYKQIHDEYRNLVDVMLGSFMDDIGITADQFQAACHMSAHDLAGLPTYFHKRLFEQIWAANDYEMFVKMMTHKNVELQLQALELFEKRHATMHNLYATDSEDLDSSRSEESTEWPDNDDVMTEIKKLQLDDVEAAYEETPVATEDFVAEKKILLSKLRNIDEKDDDKIKSSSSQEPKKIITPKPPAKVEVTEDEIRSRQEYLKQQRDKLLALKKQVREKQLGAINDGAAGDVSQDMVRRPRSAKVAKAAFEGTTPPPPPDAMQLRRALASKLRAEVVDTKDT